MPYPLIVECPDQEITLVAENVLIGMVHRLTDDRVSYKQTYRETGQPAPTVPDDLPEFVPFLRKGELSVPIESSYPIDVYIYAEGEISGSVRVDK